MMRRQPQAITLLATLVWLGTPLGSAAQAVAGRNNLRPTDVVLTVMNDTHDDGIYRASGISRICGNFDLMMPHRANSFTVEFPDDEPNLAVKAVSFDADTLPAGATITSFYLSVGVRTPSGRTPAAFVVRAREPKYNEPGTAARRTAAGTDTLRIVGVATRGTRVNLTMTIVCHP